MYMSGKKIFRFVILKRFETTCPKVCSSLPHNFSCTSILCKTSASDRMWPGKKLEVWTVWMSWFKPWKQTFLNVPCLKSHEILERTIPKWIWYDFIICFSCTWTSTLQWSLSSRRWKKWIAAQRSWVWDSAGRCPRLSPPKSGKKDGSKQMFIHGKTCCLQDCPHFLSLNGNLKYTSGKINELCFATQQHVPGFRFSWHKKQSTSPRFRNWNPTVTGWDPWIACSALNRCAVVSSAFTKLLEPQRSNLNLMKQFPQLHVGS